MYGAQNTKGCLSGRSKNIRLLFSERFYVALPSNWVMYSL